MTLNNYEVEFAGINLGVAPYCLNSLEGLGSPELRTVEVDLPNEDGITFGREFQGARRWTLTGSVKGGDPNRPSNDAEVEEAWEALSDLVAAWDNAVPRQEQRDVTELQFKRPGRETMVMYGRPERIDPDTSVSFAGHIKYTALFRQSDPYYYSTTEQTTGIGVQIPYSGGLLYTEDMEALQLPFVTSASVERLGSFFNSGNANSWSIITMQGPVLNPTIQLYEQDAEDPMWSVTLKTSIGSLESIIIDTRPWARTVLRNDGANIAGTMYGSRLSEMTVPPGFNELVYAGTDGTGTSSCSLKYRNAWKSI